MSGNETSKLPGAQRFARMKAEVKETFRKGYDAVMGHKCDNCAKTTSTKIEDQYFCGGTCHREFRLKKQACAQGRYGNVPAGSLCEGCCKLTRLLIDCL